MIMIRNEIEKKIKETITDGKSPVLILLNIERWLDFQAESAKFARNNQYVNNYLGIPVDINFKLDANEIEIRSTDPRFK
jgi:hypothetical protein